jgi:hypothetical protein
MIPTTDSQEINRSFCFNPSGVASSLKYIIRTIDKMEGLPSNKQMFLFINSQHVSAQIGHRRVIPKETHKW